MSLSPDRWKQVRRIFEEVVAHPSSEWPRRLDELCGRSGELRQEVASLLDHHDEEFLSVPFVAARSEAESISAPPPARLDRYEIIRTIGHGGFGSVYLAFDKERVDHVALKSLQRLDPRAIRGFKKGFRLLKEIRHPNLVKMFDLVSDGSSFYLSMELLEGTDLLAFSTGRPTEVLPVLGQLAAGLHALHERGVLHRDVKPLNVWVTETGRVVLLDFGMSREIDTPFASGTGALFGTPHYIAPELLEGTDPTRASDWYAVGVILHEWLAGRPPFLGTSFEILAQKRDRPVSTPIPNLVSAPADVVALCAELLEREPDARPDGPSVIARLGNGDPGLDALPRAELTGRGRQLDELSACFAHSRQEPMVVWIEGASGSGKTTLVQHFLNELRKTRSDVVALEGRCYVSEFLPYKAVDELIDELTRYLSGLPATEASAVLPRNAPLLSRVFPVMSHLTARLVAGGATNRPKDDVELRRRAFLALRELLGRLAERKRLVLFIDDAQWGDVDSVSLLTELIAPPDAPPLLWLLAYREEDAQSSPFLQELRSRPVVSELLQEHVSIEPLARQEAESLTASLFRQGGRTPRDDIVRTIASESGGSPLFVNQLVQYWLGRSEGAANAGSMTVTLDEVLVSRVDGLPKGPRELLELVVVAGRRLEASVAVRAKSGPELTADERERLVAERLLRTSPGAGSDDLEVFHDRVRETLLPRMTDGRVRKLHARIAASLEEEGGIDPERLMHHYELAGYRERAASYAEQAAEAAASSLTFDRAAELYRRLLDWGSHTPERALALRRSLASALSSAGRGYEAAREYLQLAEQAREEERFDLERLAAEHYLRSGHVDEGVALLRRLCLRVGIRFPRGTWRGLLATLWNRARVRLEGVPSGRDANEAPLPKHTENQLDLCWTAGFGIGLVDAVLGSYFHSRFFLLATRAGDARRIAMALAAEAAYSAFTGESGRRRGETIYERFDIFASRVDDPFVRGFGLAMRGTMSWLQGDFRLTRDLNVAALAMFEAEGVGVGWERTTAQIHRIGGMSMMGEWGRIAEELPALLEEAASRGDRYAHVGLRLMPYPYFVRLAADEPERARGSIEEALSDWTPDGFHIQHCDAMFGLADIALYEGRGPEALELLESKLQEMRRSHLLHAQLTRVFFYTLRARASLAALARSDGDEARRVKARALLRHDARIIRRERAPWVRGWALLLTAGVHSLDGRMEEAMGALASAELELERADLLAYKAACVWRRGTLLPGDEGKNLRSEAETWMRARGVRAPERFADMFVPGRWGGG